MSVASRGVRPLLLAAALVTSLAACAGSTTDASSDATAPSTSTAPQDGGGAAGGPQAGGGQDGRGGVSGEIAFVSDQLAQVQDDDEQTAITWTDDTTITVATTGSLADIATGACVTVVGGEEEAATAVSVAQPVDGECATPSFGGFPGGGGGEMPTDMPTGEMPTDMPTDMPTGEMPSDMPTDMPSGDPQMGGIGGATTGTVADVDGSTLTVTTEDGDVELALADDAVVTVSSAGDGDDVVVGLCATASGEDDGAGTVAATTISLSEAGDDGCTAFGGGGFGGRPGAGSDG